VVEVSSQRAVTLGVKIGYCAFGACGIAAAYLSDWRLVIVGIVLLFVCGALGLPTKEGARTQLARLEAKIGRARALADRWEFEQGGISTTTSGTIWDQLRRALDSEEPW
jgi:hypothetical protein